MAKPTRHFSARDVTTLKTQKLGEWSSDTLALLLNDLVVAYFDHYIVNAE